MVDENVAESDLRLPSMRDVVAPIFRYKRAGLLTALVVLVATAIIVLLSPKQYEAEAKLLVKRERAETLVGANPNASPQPRADVTEDELNSEVELLQGHSLLEQVALRTGLVARSGSSPDASTDRIEVARAVERLHADLKVAPLKRSTFIRVTYRSGDPAQAVRVLNELTQLYLEKHLALHRAPGAYQFFSEQAARFQKELRAAEARLSEYGRREHVVSADVEKANALQQLAAFEAALQQTRGEVAEATRRLTNLEAQAAVTPARQTTQIRTTENATFMRELETSILGLESKRNDMLRKYAPTYPPVVEVEGQLARARAALARVQQSPLTDETTDQNPTHQWLRSELARVRTEKAASGARQVALAASVRLYADKARQLEEKSAAQEHLKRAIKSAEDNYLLYLKKQEEARISDALDRTRIANVAVAEFPTVPALPSARGRTLILLLGSVMALFLGVSTTYLLNYLSPYFQSPEDVENTLNIPVLASIPARD